MQTTVTSKTGKKITLTFIAGGVTATSGDVSLGPVERTTAGFRATFPTTIGGRLVRVEVMLDAANMAAADVVFGNCARAVAANAAECADYESQRAEVLRRVNQ